MNSSSVRMIAGFCLLVAGPLWAVQNHPQLGQMVEGFAGIDRIDPGDTLGINRAMVDWPIEGIYHFNENLGQRKAWWAWEEEEVAWLTAPCPVKERSTFAFAALTGTDPGWLELYVNGHYALMFESGVETAARWERGPYRLCFRPAGKLDGNNGVYYLTVPPADITMGKPCRLRVKAVLQLDRFNRSGWKAYQLRPYPYYGKFISERERLSRNQYYFALRDITWSWSLRTDLAPLAGEKKMPLAYPDGAEFPPDDVLKTLGDGSIGLRATPQICLGQIEQEPTLERAFLQWPGSPRQVAFLGVGKPDLWGEFLHFHNGAVAVVSSGAGDFEGKLVAKNRPYNVMITMGTGDPPEFYVEQVDGMMAQRRLDGYLPGVISEWERDGIRYEQTSFATLLSEKKTDFTGAENQVLLNRIAMANPTDQPRSAHLWLSFTNIYHGFGHTFPQVWFQAQAPALEHPLRWEQGVLFTDDGLVRALLTGDADVSVTHFAPMDGPPQKVEKEGTAEQDGAKSYSWARKRGFLANVVRVTCEIPPGQSRQVTFNLPYMPEPAEQVEKLKGVRFETALADFRSDWEAKLDQGMKLHTPDDFLNQLWKAGVADLYIVADHDGLTGLDTMKYTPTYYDAFGIHLAMSIAALDYRGLHEDAARYLELFVRRQGQADVWPGFQSKEGMLGDGSWVNGNGWVLGALARHARFSGDQAWYERVLPNMLASCDWVLNELKATREATHPSGAPITGLLPKGRWTDDPSKDYYFGWSDTINYWGLKMAADLLADKGHSRADELLKEAERYRQDILRAARWAAAHSPKFRCRGGEEVPFVPAGVLKRRKVLHPWYIVECGSLNMVPYGVLDANDELVDWMLRVAEETPSCMRYGTSTSEPCYGPQRIAYLRRGQTDRGELNKFLESFYTLLACYFDRQTLTSTEEVYGVWGAAASHGWLWQVLRLMLVEEQGDDLVLLQGIPRAWLADGQSLTVEGICTYFGKMSLEVKSSQGARKIEVSVRPPDRQLPGQIILCVRHPEGLLPDSATMNGESVEIDRDTVRFRPSEGENKVVISF